MPLSDFQLFNKFLEKYDLGLKFQVVGIHFVKRTVRNRETLWMLLEVPTTRLRFLVKTKIQRTTYLDARAQR